MGLPDNHFSKSPHAKLDYTIDWTDALEDGETISEASWSIPSGLTDEQSESNTTTSQTVWVSGGTLGTKYALRGDMVSSEGREDSRTIYITIEER